MYIRLKNNSKKEKKQLGLLLNFLIIIIFISTYLMITRKPALSERQLKEINIIMGKDRGIWQQPQEFIQELPSLLPLVDRTEAGKAPSLEKLFDHYFHWYNQIFQKYDPEIFTSFPTSLSEFREKFNEELTKHKKLAVLSFILRKSDGSLDLTKNYQKVQENRMNATTSCNNVKRLIDRGIKKAIEESVNPQLENYLNQFPSLNECSELNQWVKQFIKVFLLGRELCSLRNASCNRGEKKFVYSIEFKFQEIKSPWNEETIKFPSGFVLKQEPKIKKCRELNYHFV